MKRCGFVAVLGETNAGKSTLINQLVGQKVSIVSRKAQTTLSRILGIAIHGESQIIFVDTPGFLKNRRVENLEKTAWNAFRESEEILFVIDVCKKKIDTSVELLQKIHDDKKVSLVMNKIDLIHKPKLLEIADSLGRIRNFENIFMVSSLTGSGTAKILDYLASAVPEGEWLYEADQITDSSFEKYASEITREHIYHRLHQEIPYKCVVKTEDYNDQPDGSIKIVQNIYVKNDAHRVIFLGHRGGKIKAIGEAARKELSHLLEREVHLFLHVVLEDKHHPQERD
ncbi:MAG: GTPase Era [Holosporaceae bacterium]|nr:GTPase Era [Holosporaceae bacterium]